VKRCSSCSKDIPDAAMHCVFCGSKQPPVGPQQTVMGYASADLLHSLGVQHGQAPQPAQPPPQARPVTPRPAPAPARFKIGDRVRAKNIHPTTHTRLPRYARGHVGVVERLHGAHVFPDSVTTGKGEDPQWLYTVRFDAQELWGADADPKLKVSIEAFEPYLEHV